MTSVPIRRPYEDPETHREGGRVMIEAETKVRQLQVKECQGLNATIRNWEKQGNILPRISEGAWPCRHVGRICKI